MTADQRANPKVVLMLPGEWISVRPDDERAVEKFLALAEHEAPVAQSLVEQSTAAGAALLMFRVRSSPAVLLSVIWPHGEESGKPTMEATQQRLGRAGVAIDHSTGYSCVRARSTSEESTTDTLTYAVTHPTTGRLLVVRVVAFDVPFDELDVGDYDLAVGQLTWDER